MSETPTEKPSLLSYKRDEPYAHKDLCKMSPSFATMILRYNMWMALVGILYELRKLNEKKSA
jgi:hypothetical protein